MKLKFFFALFFFSSLISLSATETNWDGETPFNAYDCRTQPKQFVPKDDSKAISFLIKHGKLEIKESPDSFIKVQAKGSRKNLKKIIFSKDNQGYSLKDENRPVQTSINSSVVTSINGLNGVEISSGGAINISTVYRGGTYIGSSSSMIRTCGTYKSLDSTKDQNLVTQRYLAVMAGEDSQIGSMNLNNVSLKNLRMGPYGLIKFGQIISGQVEQNGKTYGPGTIFNDGIPDRADINDTNTSVENMKKSKSEKPTIVTLHLPKAIRTWDVSFQGAGDSQTKVDKIYAKTIEAEFSDNAQFDLSKSKSHSLHLIGNNDTKLNAKGSILDLINLKVSNNSEITFTQQAEKKFQTLAINSQNYGKITCYGNHSVCNRDYTINAQNSSHINVQELYVLASKADIKINNYGKVTLNCSFNSFNASLNNSSELTIQEFEKSSEKSIKENLKLDSLYSTITIKNYGKFILSDWINKIIVDVLNSGEFTASVSRPTESTIITAQNYAKVKFLMPVARAKITAKNSADVSLVEVTDTLEDHASNYAKINVDKKPGKDFKF
ncbi:MAG: hypothetical protein ACRYGR_00965 [Janthinobacterium lividum]